VPGEGHKDGVPKTKKSRRTIIAPPQVVEVIAPLLEGRARDDLVFTAVRGGRVRHSAFYRLVWRKAWREVALAGVDQDDPKAVAAALDKYGDLPRIHDLRHTFASWAIEMGIGLEAIQDQLGHESILTTRKIYGHLQPAMREALADAMYRALAQGRLPVEEVPRLDP
jgi:integrase